jgi:ATP adenylyltransferase
MAARPALTARFGDNRAMNNDALWSPWRMAYLRALERREADARVSGGVTGGSSNFLDAYWRSPERDRESLVVFRDALGMILLNRYPYVNGHLLVALGEPRAELADYDPDARAAFWRLVERAMELAKRTLEPQGLNVGINEGRAAGAGLPEHVHAHVVPRWNGDVNFLATVGSVRVIPDALESVWSAYRATVVSLGW